MIKKLKATDLLSNLLVKRGMEVEAIDNGLTVETVRVSLTGGEEGTIISSLVNLHQVHPHHLLQVVQDHPLLILDLLVLTAGRIRGTRNEEI